MLTHSEFIKALGGGTEVAKLLLAATGEEVDREAIYKWQDRDLIPWRWRVPLLTIAKERGQEVPAEFLPGVAA